MKIENGNFRSSFPLSGLKLARLGTSDTPKIGLLGETRLTAGLASH
jgi:hypothetical protein